MTPERWERISEVLEKALSLATTQRDQYLTVTCAGDFELRREVESLIASHHEAGSQFLNVAGAVAQGAADTTPRADVRAGRRIGPYLVEDEIGHGGMGEVFAALRADGTYEKKVALKLVRSGYDTALLLERFRNERQILASLDHPNIARLLDGGTTDDGIPYLVMELVEGQPIDAYCDARKLTVTERVQLFGQVCGAVQYAHQHLVIHRDIKPSNILVTQEGTPKLLDFGIAKLLDASGATEATVLRPMTPEYASPEQLRGEPITTATDVYSLGVVLYQLLTGRSPYRVDKRTAGKLAEAITQDEPERPSASVERTESVLQDGALRELTAETVSRTREVSPLGLQRRLRGDLDFVLLKALRKEPALRYASVEHFAGDLRNHLEGIPVSARKGTWIYRTVKFTRRHKAGVAAAALVLITLVTGVAITVREARIAEANRRRAEARFNDVRKLANSLIFEVHDSIANLPGATQALQLILQRSLEYLDRLSTESGNEPSLLRELATAYSRIGSLQGNPQDPNLGDTKSALASYRKSLELRESLARLNLKNSTDQVELAAAYLDYSDFQRAAAGNVAAAFDYCKKALAILDQEAVGSPDDVRIVVQSMRGHVNLGMIQVGEGAMGSIGTASGGVSDLQKALLLQQRAVQLAPSNLSYQAQGAVINGVLGDAVFKLGNRAAALNYYRSGIEILDALNPKGDNIRFASNATILTSKIGDVYLLDGQNTEAVRYYAEAQQEAARLKAMDPKNEFLRRTEITSSAELGLALIEAGRVEEGVRYLRTTLEAVAGEPSQTPLMRTLQGVFHMWMGEALEHQGRIRAASLEYARGQGFLSTVRAGGSNDLETQFYFCSVTERLAGSLLKLGQTQGARQQYEQSLALLSPLSHASPDDQDVLYALAESYTGEGMLAEHLAESSHLGKEKVSELQAASEWFQRSLNAWNKISNPARINSIGAETTLPPEVSRHLAQCNLELSSSTVSDRQLR